MHNTIDDLKFTQNETNSDNHITVIFYNNKITIITLTKIWKIKTILLEGTETGKNIIRNNFTISEHVDIATEDL